MTQTDTAAMQDRLRQIKQEHAARIAELERERDEARNAAVESSGIAGESCIKARAANARAERLERENTALNVETEQRAKWQWEAINRAERLEAALRTIAEGTRDADQSYASLFAELVREARAALSADAPATDVQLPRGWLAAELERVNADTEQWCEGMKDSFSDATGIAIPPAPAPSKGGR